jgi:hypothetical protein
MSPLPSGQREVRPSKRALGNRRGVSFGRRLNISVPISFGLPLVVIGSFLVISAFRTDSLLFYALGGVTVLAGVILFASGKRL